MRNTPPKRIVYIECAEPKPGEIVLDDGRRIKVDTCDARVVPESDPSDAVWLNRLPVVCVGCGREFFACDDARALCLFCQEEVASKRSEG